jgi:uncharacterized protein (DUF1697 family)
VAAVPRFAAFLRGVNLGPHRRVSGAQLCAAVAELGFSDPATFRASGNVVFTAADERDESVLTARLEQGLAAALGFETRVFLRSGAELCTIAAFEPFPSEDVAASAGKLQVSLLEREPPTGRREQVLGFATADDRLVLRGRQLYWLPSGGLLESALDLKALERLLGPTTRRTKGTLDLLAAKFFAD